MFPSSKFIAYFCLIGLLRTASPNPMLSDLPNEETLVQVRDTGTGTEERGEFTTEGVLTSMWHKITNFFQPGTESSSLMPTSQRPNQSAGDNERPSRMVAPETRRGNLPHDLRRVQPENGEDIQLDEGGVLAPMEDFGEPTRNLQFDKRFEDEGAALNEVRKHPRKKRYIFAPREFEVASYTGASEDGDKRLQKETKNLANGDTQPVVEEFDQGQFESGRKKRFKDIPSNVWITEKFAEGSDAIENIDKENFIKEIQNDPLLLQDPTLQPIIVEDQMPDEHTTASKVRELPPIQIFDY